MAWTDRLINLFRTRQLAREIDEELGFHLKSRIRDNVAAGMTPEEAARDATARFGNRTATGERMRDADLVGWLESVAQDVRFSLAMMRRHAAFTAMAVALLALGIGASTGMFSLLLATVFRSAPYEHSDRLVYLARQENDRSFYGGVLPYRDLAELRAHNRGLERLAPYRGGAWVLNTANGPERVRGYFVSSDWLPALDTQPAMGRNFLPEEEQVGRGEAAILSYGLWRRAFGADSNVVGRQFTVDERSYTVIGVLGDDFDFEGAELYLPLAGDERTQCSAVARLRRGTAVAQAQSEMDALVKALQPALLRDSGPKQIVLATPAMRASEQCGPTCEQQHRGVWLLFGAVALVMLMTCANVANLLLARAMGRQREFEIRGAIGCSRTRLARQVLTESIVLFLFGGAAGVGVAKWTTVLLATYASAYAGRRIPLDERALAFAATVTLVTGVLFGLIPALRSRPAVSRSVDTYRTRVRGVLIASEFALALIVLAGFGLLMRSFLSVQSVPLGFRAENLLTAETTLRDKRFKDGPRRIELVRQLLETVRAIPGVESAAMTSSLPLSGADATRVRIEGREPSNARGDEVRYINASAGLFGTLEMPLIEGVGISEHDSAGSESVAVVNQTMARMFFAGGAAVGARIQMEDEPGIWRKVVGMAGDIRQRNLEEDSRPLFYRPYPQGMDSDIALVVRARSESDMGALTRALRKAVAGVEPRQPWGEWKSMRQVIYDSESLTLRRPIVAMLGAFGLLALLLASAGLYAVLSYWVTERTREIGIRLALGGQRTQLLGKIVGDALRMAAPGVAAGAFAAYELGSLLPSGHIGWSGSGVFLYGVTRMDAITYVGAVLILGSVSVLATFVPARRAMRVDPVAALRHE